MTDLDSITHGLPTKSAKIRALHAHGVPRADIARHLGIRYQHVYNVLQQPLAATHPAAAPPVAPGPAAGEADEAVRLERIAVDADGAVMLPPHVLAAMKVSGAEDLIARVDGDGELHLSTARGALDKVRRMIAESDFAGRSVVDELIAERRAEAAREEAESILADAQRT